MPDLIHHASLNMSSVDVMRFLGRKLHPLLQAEVSTDAKGRPEGWRVKHRLARNWIKVYNKFSVLRVETVINNPDKVKFRGPSQSSKTTKAGVRGGGPR